MVQLNIALCNLSPHMTELNAHVFRPSLSQEASHSSLLRLVQAKRGTMPKIANSEAGLDKPSIRANLSSTKTRIVVVFGDQLFPTETRVIVLVDFTASISIHQVESLKCVAVLGLELLDGNLILRVEAEDGLWHLEMLLLRIP